MNSKVFICDYYYDDVFNFLIFRKDYYGTVLKYNSPTRAY